MKRLGKAVAIVLVLAGCSEETKTVCAPGATQACVCAGAPQGAQSCASDGSRWEACACATAAPSSAPAAAVATGAAAPAKPAPQADEDTSPPVNMPPEDEEPAVPTGPKAYVLTVVSANIAPSKPDGKPWDAGDGPPDVVATVQVDGAGAGTVRSSKAENTTAPTWNQSGNVTINVGDRLVVTVIDKDLAADDPIGTISHQFKRPGRITLKGGSVNSLVIDVAAK